MIKTLYIKDFVLIDELNIELDEGLNILTGETGSGKSIIIDAIDLALGARASKDQIKTGMPKAIIELGIKLNPDFPHYLLEENGIETDASGLLIISKEISQSGSRSRVNGTMASQGFIQELRNFLLDIHSQNETYRFISPKTHIDLLDNYGDDSHNELLQKYKKTFAEFKSTEKELETSEVKLADSEQRIDFLKFQTEEIQKVKILNLNEYNELSHERELLVNAQELQETAMQGYELLYSMEGSIIDTINTYKNKLLKISKIDKKLSELAELIESSSINLKEASDGLRDFSENLEINPQKLSFIEERLETLQKIKKKYGPELSDALQKLEQFELELEKISMNDENIENLRKKLSMLDRETQALAERLSASRDKLSKELSELVEEKLSSLEMPKASFEIAVSQSAGLYLKGRDEVEFLISPNPGEPIKPLAKIASGGEISRVMLAIKTVFAHSDNINTVIFDEIDTGVSGKTSQSIAEALSELAASRQVICITHQAIIAAAADRHIYISKEQDDYSTKILIKALDTEERIKALALLAGGSDKSAESLKFAANLLSQSRRKILS